MSRREFKRIRGIETKPAKKFVQIPSFSVVQRRGCREEVSRKLPLNFHPGLWKFGRVGEEVWWKFGAVFQTANIVKFAVKTNENVAFKHEKASGSFSRGARKFGGSLAPAGSTESEKICRILQNLVVQILRKSTTFLRLKICTHFLLIRRNSVTKVCFNFG